MSILVFLVLAILSSTLSHYLLKTYVPAAVVSAFITAITFQIVSYLVDGYVDPLFIIAVVVTWLLSFGISLLIGIPFLLERRNVKQ